MQDDTPDHTTVSSNGYTVTFHPAFARRVAAHLTGEGETELYQQSETYHFKDGKTHPKRHQIRFRGGKHARDITLSVNDPGHAIARIVIEFHGEGHVPGSGGELEVVERVALDNGVETCPPQCLL